MIIQWKRQVLVLMICWCSLHTVDVTRQDSFVDKTVVSRLDPVSTSPRWRCEHNLRRNKTVLSCLQLCSHRPLDKIRQFCLVSNSVFTPPTRQFCPVSTQFRWVLSCRVGGLNTIGDATKLSSCRVGGVNKPLQFYSVKDGSIYQWRVKIHWSICLLSTQKSTTSFA